MGKRYEEDGKDRRVSLRKASHFFGYFGKIAVSMAQNAYKKGDGGYEKYRAEQWINPSNSTVNGQKRGNNEIDEQYAIEQDVHSYMVGGTPSDRIHTGNLR